MFRAPTPAIKGDLVEIAHWTLWGALGGAFFCLCLAFQIPAVLDRIGIPVGDSLYFARDFTEKWYMWAMIAGAVLSFITRTTMMVQSHRSQRKANS